MVTLAFSPLSNDELEQFVSQFLGDQEIQFSAAWKLDLIERLLALDSVTPRQFIDKVHSDKLLELQRSGARWLRAHSTGYSTETIEDIVSNAFLKWLRHFDGRKGSKSSNPELNYLLCCIKSARSDEFDANQPVINEEYLLETNDLTSGRPVRSKRRAVMLNIDEVHPNQHQEYLSKTVHPDQADNQVKLGGKYFSPETAIEIYKFNIVAGRTQKPNRKRARALPDIEVAYKPIRSRIIESTRLESVNLTSASKFHRARFRNLKHAELRRWMELAMLEMRKSKAKMASYLRQKRATLPNFKSNEFAARIPLLSAVALDARGNLVAKCYKGQIDDPTLEERAWYKHCEFSLFEEVIQDRNMRFVDGGTLFVTLEPCNKRGFYLDAKGGKPKIPCAVRCVEAGIKTVYIGALDFNKNVYKKGQAILESGRYSFDMDHLDEASKLLDAYFDSKGYAYEISGKTKTYKIGAPVKVSRFDDDLIEEICEINSFFLQAHQRSAFR
jgi:pyrimidine deaminase RibD-like protein